MFLDKRFVSSRSMQKRFNTHEKPRQSRLPLAWLGVLTGGLVFVTASSCFSRPSDVCSPRIKVTTTWHVVSTAIHVLSLFAGIAIQWIRLLVVRRSEQAYDDSSSSAWRSSVGVRRQPIQVHKSYARSSLVPDFGATGADIKRAHFLVITTTLVPWRFRNIVILVTGIAAITFLSAGLTSAQTQPTNSANSVSFEVASIKRTKSVSEGVLIRFMPGGRFVANGVTAKLLLLEAYGIKESQISGGPSWFDSERFEIEARSSEVEAAKISKLSPKQRNDEFQQMLRALLAERFMLTLHHATKELPVYVLTIAKNGPKFQESTYRPPEDQPDSPQPFGKAGRRPQGVWITGRGRLTATNADLPMFANTLARVVLREMVFDKTGLSGKYDFNLEWTPDGSEELGVRTGPEAPTGGIAGSTSSGPSLFTAIHEQLGLRLESQKAPVDVLVIDHLDRPSEN
jgi:uncharacterized protein (TIGR03435 family)